MKEPVEKKEKFLEVYKAKNRLATRACKAFGMSRSNFYFWCKTDPDFKSRVEEIEDMQIDYVEDKLFEQIDKGSEKSIQFYLKYKGRKKGYTNQLDIKSEGITFNFISDDKKDNDVNGDNN